MHCQLQTVADGLHQRAKVLGEEDLKAPPPSVFEFISAKNRERIAALVASGKRPAEASTPQPPPEAVHLIVPVLDKAVAAAALKGFMPFGDDRPKQNRYRFYLEAQAGLKEGEFAPKATERVAELNKELEDFAKSARVFKPMSHAMSSRFTSGSSTSTALDLKQPQAGLRRVTSTADGSTAEASSSGAVEKLLPTTETNEQQAVRLDMFGALTRTVKPFYPVRLLCKRFNVPNPHPAGQTGEDEGEDDADDKDLLNKATMEELRRDGGYSAPTSFYDTSSVSGATDAPDAAPKAATGEAPPKPIGSVGLGEDETQGKNTLTYERPSMDLFKAIFAESEDEDEENAPPTQRKSSPAQVVDTAALKSTEKLAEPALPTSNPLEPVSFADFRPTFVVKAERTTTEAIKPKKSKKKTKAALSFDVDEGEEEDGSAPSIKVKRKASEKDSSSKKRRKDVEPSEPAEEEWVEKAAPVLPAKVGRAKASDFL